MLSLKAAKRSVDASVTAKDLKVMMSDSFSFQECEEIVQRCTLYGIQGVDKEHTSYHYKRGRLPNPPGVMYRIGDISLLDMPLLGIVGPRTPSIFLQTITKDLCSRLGAYEIVTISGGAEGIDKLAHLGSLEVGVPTIIVLGGGFRRYQKRHERQFFQNVIDAGGLVLSEWKLDQVPAQYTFPQRNRIIAGCADVVFVPGAATGSGSLITVDFAREFGIPVVTVPGSYYEPTCAGTNEYLCQKKIAGTNDIPAFLEQYFVRRQEYGIRPPNESSLLSDDERAVLVLLRHQPVAFGFLIQGLSWEIPHLLEILLGLEMKQRVYSPEPGYYATK